MENNKTLSNSISGYRYRLARNQLAILSFILLSIRGCFGWLGYNTIGFTIILNLFLIASIDYKHVNKLFLLIPFLIISMINNKTILGIIDLFVMCLILKNEKISKLAFIYLIILLVFIPIWLFLLKEGYIISKRWFDPAKGGESWDYGFENPNGLGIFGFHLSSCSFLLLYKRHLLLSIFVTIIIAQLFFSISLCRTAWVGEMILALSSILLYYKLYRSWMKFPIAVFPIIIFLVIFIFSKNVGNFEVFDILFSGRLSIWKGIINTMNPLNWLFGASQSDLTIDGSFAMLLFLGGMVLVSIFCHLFYKMIMNNFNIIMPYLPFILSVLACGVMETTFSACGGLSVIFWYFLINYSQKTKICLI